MQGARWSMSRFRWKLVQDLYSKQAQYEAPRRPSTFNMHVRNPLHLDQTKQIEVIGCVLYVYGCDSVRVSHAMSFVKKSLIQ